MGGPTHQQAEEVDMRGQKIEECRNYCRDVAATEQQLEGRQSGQVFSTRSKKNEVSYGYRGTIHRGSVDAREVLRAEMNTRDIDSAYRDFGAAQGEAGKINEERRKMLVMGNVVLPTAPGNDRWRVLSGIAKQRDGLRDVVHGHVDGGVELLGFEFQPIDGSAKGRIDRIESIHACAMRLNNSYEIDS